MLQLNRRRWSEVQGACTTRVQAEGDGLQATSNSLMVAELGPRPFSPRVGVALGRRVLASSGLKESRDAYSFCHLLVRFHD